MTTLLDFVASHGVPFTVRIVRTGDRYGLNDCLVHDGEKFNGDALVEFYDARYRHTQYGQFVSRYYAHTLLTKDMGRGQVAGGLLLDGNEPAQWVVDAGSMTKVIAWLQENI